jgi:hypothetical protein
MKTHKVIDMSTRKGKNEFLKWIEGNLKKGATNGKGSGKRKTA